MHANTGKSKHSIMAAGLVVLTTTIILGAFTALGKWGPILVMIAAVLWFAKIAFLDRLLTAEEKHIRADLRKFMP